MGGTFARKNKETTAPRFVVQAMRDPGVAGQPGSLLQVVQIVKGTISGAGKVAQVFDVAGRRDNGASVDLQTCEQKGVGQETLCGTWVDPDFDPNQPSYYYVRVLENPSCRWSTRLCNALAERPSSCSDPQAPRLIQERAWASPIYYLPELAPRSL